MTRHFKKLLIIFPLLFFATHEAYSTEAGKPNIIFFLADDISQKDLGCYGHPKIKTPHIEALAAKERSQAMASKKMRAGNSMTSKTTPRSKSTCRKNIAKSRIAC